MKTASRTHWHRLLGKLLELLLTPLGITVQVDFPLMSEPPRSDILLLRRSTRYWTGEQVAYLADGIRTATANHILLELKYTESLTAERVEKVHGYDIFYRTTQNLSVAEVASFILSAKTPQASLLRQYGYKPTRWAGVYQSPYPMVERVGLILLNELEPEPHNIYFKLFASQKNEKKKAFTLLKHWQQLPQKLWSYFLGLEQVMLPKPGDVEMQLEITPEYVMKLGTKMRKELLKTYSIEERLLGLKPEERLLGLKPEERLHGLESYLIEREQQGVLKSLLRTLRLRLKANDGDLAACDKPLRQLGLAKLEELLEVALTVDTLGEFMQILHAEETRLSESE